MTALGLLAEIIALGGKTAASTYRQRPGYNDLSRHSFVVEAGVMASVVCDECDMPHAAEVAFEDGRYGYYCPDLGFIALERSAVEAVRPDPGRLVLSLADAFGCKRRKTTPILGQTWRIGALNTDACDVMLYFQPTLYTEDDTRDLTDALRREVRAQWRLVVTAAGTMPVAGAQAVRLDDLAELDRETGALRILAAPPDLLGMPRKNPGGRPSAHGDLLRPLIEKRIQTGQALKAINAEFLEVRNAFKAAYPNHPLPSESAIKRYIRSARENS